MSRHWITLMAAMFLMPMIAIGQTRNPSQSFFPEAGLKAAAEETYANYNRAFQAEINKTLDFQWPGIPPKYWAEAIKALKPVNVYLHRMNVVVVQRIANGIEEGKYICLIISSYLPQNGVDGFEFTPNPQRDNKFYAGGDVFDYKRVMKK